MTCTDPMDWWDTLETEVLQALERTGATTPYLLGQSLGLPEAATASLLALLVHEGKVKMCLVQRVSDSLVMTEAVQEGKRLRTGERR